jgi:THAP4-like, heme-binding beta-barrel domain
VSTEPASGAARPGAPDSAPSPSPPSPSAPSPSSPSPGAPGPGGPELHPLLAPLRFLIGRWEGAGVVGYPTIESSNFGQEISFSHNGKPYLYYVSRSWALEQDGTIGRPLAMETGFWRPQEDGVLEVVLAHSSGITEIYLGEVTGTKIEMATDAVVRTASAKDVTAGRRLYGLIGLDLGYAYDMAAMGYPLQSHLSAQLKRVSL